MYSESIYFLLAANNMDNEIKRDNFRGDLNKPSPPQLVISSELQINNGTFKIGSNMVIQCISRKGIPPATFLWFLGKLFQ